MVVVLGEKLSVAQVVKVAAFKMFFQMFLSRSPRARRHTSAYQLDISSFNQLISFGYIISEADLIISKA